MSVQTSAGIRIAKITPKANSSTTDWPATTITITVTATDLAGNMSIKSMDVLLAARSGTGTQTMVDADRSRRKTTGRYTKNW